MQINIVLMTFLVYLSTINILSIVDLLGLNPIWLFPIFVSIILINRS